jgi:hypothetical protein
MVPHSLFFSSDRHVDLALNVLTLIVGGGLFATAAVIGVMWLRPVALSAEFGYMGPPVLASAPEVRLDPPRLEFDFQFPYGLTLYRCEHRGQITYTDRPCLVGNERSLLVLPL